MVTPLSQITVGQALSSIRDIAMIGSILFAGWKARSFVQPVFDFFQDAKEFFETSKKHMQLVESGMDTLLGNHLRHIQADLGHMSGRDMRTPDIITVSDATGHSDSVEV